MAGGYCTSQNVCSICSMFLPHIMYSTQFTYEKQLAVMFCCVCVSIPVEGWDTRTLVSTPFTEPTKTAPPAARCFYWYPVISIFYPFFCLFDLNQVENIHTSWCFKTPKCSSTCRPQPDMGYPARTRRRFLEDRSSKKRGSVTKIQKPIWAWPSAKDVFWNA